MTGDVDRERLVRVLGMLGSLHDGEVVAAARQAERIRQEARLTWYDIVLPGLPSPGQVPWPDSRTADADDYLDYLADRMADMTEWEQGFTVSLRARPGRFLTKKQLDCLLAIAERVHRAERRAARAAA